MYKIVSIRQPDGRGSVNVAIVYTINRRSLIHGRYLQLKFEYKSLCLPVKAMLDKSQSPWRVLEKMLGKRLV
jgi:hypothetical protein